VVKSNHLGLPNLILETSFIKARVFRKKQLSHFI